MEHNNSRARRLAKEEAQQQSRQERAENKQRLHTKRVQEEFDQLKDNKIYDELNDMRARCATQLVQMAETVEFAGKKDLHPFVTDKRGLVTNVRALKRDFDSLSAEFKQITKEHEGRAGASTDPDDHWGGLQVGQKYVEWSGKFTGAVVPVIGHTLEIMTQAAIAHDAANPQTVTDVEAKPEASEQPQQDAQEQNQPE